MNQNSNYDTVLFTRENENSHPFYDKPAPVLAYWDERYMKEHGQKVSEQTQ